VPPWSARQASRAVGRQVHLGRVMQARPGLRAVEGVMGDDW
jgi:hypothetical protein